MMKKSFAYLASTIGCLAMASAPLASQNVGVNSAVRNNVQVKQTASGNARQAQLRQRVRIGNQISTGGNSTLQVTLLDRSSITVGPNSRMTINRFVYDPSRNGNSVGASVAKGTFRFLSGKSSNRNNVTTPSASIGIRGTMLEGAVGEDALSIAASEPNLSLPAEVDPETATIVVLRGPGPDAPATEKRGLIEVTSGGQTVSLSRPGQAAFIPAVGAAPIVFNLSAVGYQGFDQVLRTQPGNFVGPQSSSSSGQSAIQQAGTPSNAGQTSAMPSSASEPSTAASSGATGAGTGGMGAGSSTATAGGGIGLSAGVVGGITAAAIASGVVIAATSDGDERTSP